MPLVFTRSKLSTKKDIGVFKKQTKLEILNTTLRDNGNQDNTNDMELKSDLSV